jgi:IS30 family transposase
MGKPSFATVYNDPKRGLRRDPRALADATGRSLKDARAYLASTATTQAQKAWRRPALSAYSTTGGPSGEYQADVVYLAEFVGINNRALAILTLLEATTRYVYARALTNDSAKATAAALESMIATNMEDDAPIISSLVIDGGGEFKGVTRQLIDSKHIRVNQVAPRTHQRLARVNRLHTATADR